MQRNLTLGSLALATAALAIVATTFLESPTLPAGVPQPKLVHAERFVVEQPFEHVWRADHPVVRDGWLLVLEVPDKELLRPTQLKQPVLYAGAQTADRVNVGYQSGHVVALVPGDFDPAAAPIWFGAPALPEELTEPAIRAALQAAQDARARPANAEELGAAVTDEVGRYPTDFELRLRAIDLVERYSPQERDLIAGWRVPRVR
ncbi:MAG: hypothetical protein KDB80_08325 [Planctomycetes bacterium]|nr:hypothetical protein [Planctomycetota bacterium]